MSDIITGSKQVTSNGKRGRNGYGPSAFLFDYNSTKTVSHIVEVEPGQAYQVSTFGLQDDKFLTLQRVYVGDGVMAFGSSCMCETIEGRSVQVLANEPFKINGKKVKIDNRNGVFVLNIPGVYMFEVSDKGILGQFLALIEASNPNNIPNSLLIGNSVTGELIGVEE